MALCGGVSKELKEADEEVQAICDKIKPKAEVESGRKFDVFKATHYKTQVVAGTNFFIKVHVGNNNYVHLRVYRTLPCAGETLKLSAMLVDKSESDEVQYFEASS
ncbi:predicted protein [Nematostella vectensis]|uniref:Cystatin domain-containing protein n=1 Tax=Nematostella vectensis TaxID=45351 RepID=A7SBS4_NEMVE|nr:cystatin-B [Nematostella vectensis]EDO38843.1 predicted protein [Nematostella vectensis]|eukprot:XP_001630906.1 predicted protein [Nematostella vectensis]